MYTLYQLDEANARRMAEWPGSDEIDLCFTALEMAGEAGELANACKKIVRLDRDIHGTVEDRQALLREAADEIGDVIITAALVARKLGLDTARCVEDKFNATSVKHGLDTRLADDKPYSGNVSTP